MTIALIMLRCRTVSVSAERDCTVQSNKSKVSKMENIFNHLTKEELRQINEDRLKAKEEGLRPRSFDSYIEIIIKKYPLTFSEGWSFVEDLFFEEISKRFFEKKYLTN